MTPGVASGNIEANVIPTVADAAPVATPEEQDGTARSCTNGIFQECRNSPAMKRVLMVWGRVGV